jgi:hypothetical protein
MRDALLLKGPSIVLPSPEEAGAQFGVRINGDVGGLVGDKKRENWRRDLRIVGIGDAASDGTQIIGNNAFGLFVTYRFGDTSAAATSEPTTAVLFASAAAILLIRRKHLRRMRSPV